MCHHFLHTRTLTPAQVVLSSPAVGMSGAGSLEFPAVPVLNGCEWDSCPALSPAQGFNASDRTCSTLPVRPPAATHFCAAKLNYVNSFP